MPINIRDALNDPTWAAEWRAALETELSNLMEHEVFSVVPVPADGIDNFVDTKVVFKCKPDQLGFIDKFKIRIVARGFTQIHGVDYWSSYAPVVRGATFRMQMADAIQRGLKTVQIDF